MTGTKISFEDIWPTVTHYIVLKTGKGVYLESPLKSLYATYSTTVETIFNSAGLFLTLLLFSSQLFFTQECVLLNKMLMGLHDFIHLNTLNK